jgi:hypothetical protein
VANRPAEAHGLELVSVPRQTDFRLDSITGHHVDGSPVQPELLRHDRVYSESPSHRSVPEGSRQAMETKRNPNELLKSPTSAAGVQFVKLDLQRPEEASNLW